MIKINIFFNIIIIILLTLLYIIYINYIHPISLIIILIIYRLITCILISIHSYNYIYSIIFFLIIIRGLLIIFLYFASLISNDQNTFKFKIISLINVRINFFIIIIIFNKIFKYIWYYSIELNNISLINIPLFSNIFKIYDYPFNNITLLCLLYLLISLFTIIKICSIKTKSLRKLN